MVIFLWGLLTNLNNLRRVSILTIAMKHMYNCVSSEKNMHLKGWLIWYTTTTPDMILNFTNVFPFVFCKAYLSHNICMQNACYRRPPHTVMSMSGRTAVIWEMSDVGRYLPGKYLTVSLYRAWYILFQWWGIWAFFYIWLGHILANERSHIYNTSSHWPRPFSVID